MSQGQSKSSDAQTISRLHSSISVDDAGNLADARWAWMERHSNRILATGALVAVNIVIIEVAARQIEMGLVYPILVLGLVLALFLLLRRVVVRMMRSAVTTARREALVARHMMHAVEQIGAEHAGFRGTVEALAASAHESGLELYVYDDQDRSLWSPTWGQQATVTAAMSHRLEQAMHRHQILTIDGNASMNILPDEVTRRGGSASLLAAPMWSGDEFIGLVMRRYANEHDLAVMGVNDSALIGSFAALGAVAIGKAIVVDREQQRARDNELLMRSVHAASECVQRDKLADHAVQAAQALNSPQAAIFALSSGKLRLAGAYGIDRLQASGSGSVRVRSRLVELVTKAGAHAFACDINALDDASKVVLMRLGFRDEVIVQPLRDDSGVSGFVAVVAESGSVPSGSLTLLTAIGHQASMAIERTRMLRSIRKRSRHLACTPKLARSLTGVKDEHATARIAARELHEGFGFGRVTIALNSYVHSGTSKRVGSEGMKIAASAGALAHTGGTIACTDAMHECFETGRPHVSVTGDVDASNSGADHLSQHDPDAPAGCRGRIVVPIAGRDHRVVGVIAVYERDADALGEDDLHMLETIADQLGGTIEQAGLFATLERSYFETVEALSSALEAKDAYTLDHARSITDMSAQVGQRLGMRGDEIRDLKLGALLHDIGKIGIPEKILSKPGPLTDDEFEVMKEHTVIGEQIIAPIEFLQGVRPMVLHEHERWDGKGYPHQLRGDEIPLGARIIFVCDAWHAMTSDRPYRKALPNSEAIAQLREGGGTQFDPAVVEAFIEMMERADGSDTGESLYAGTGAPAIV